jgi:hypothetical protein
MLIGLQALGLGDVVGAVFPERDEVGFVIS